MPTQPYLPKSLASLLLLAGLFCIHTTSLAANEHQQLKQIQQDISELRSDLSSGKQRQNNLQSELKSLEKEIAQVSRKLRQSDKKLKQQRGTHTHLQKETRQLSSKLSQQREQLGQQMRAGYSAGQQQALKLLLNQTNPAEAGRTLAYYGYFTQAQLKTVNETQISIQQLNSATEKLEASTQQLKTLIGEQKKQKNKLDQRKQSRNLLLAKLNKDIQSKEQQLEKLLNDEKALAKILEELQKREEFAFTNLRQAKGKLTLPTQGRIRHNYGESRKLGKLRWKGILITGKEGQAIKAIAPGKVVFADWIRGYGLILIVDHGNSYMSLYGHNQSLYKETGDTVEANETIATLGDSGGNSAPGLYFELRHKGKPINPQGWFK